MVERTSLRTVAMRAAASLMLAIALGNGCSSYQTIPIEDIKANPDTFTGKHLRVLYPSMEPETTGVTPVRPSHERGYDYLHQELMYPVPWTVTLQVSQVQFPVASGITVSEPMMFGKTSPPETVLIDLQQSGTVEQQKFDAGRTALAVVCALAVAGLAYAAYRAIQDAASDTFVGILGGDYR